LRSAAERFLSASLFYSEVAFCGTIAGDYLRSTARAETILSGGFIVAEVTKAYPINLSIDYPDKKMNRITTFFRLLTAIPIFIIFTLITGGIIVAGDFVFIPTVLMLLFLQKYPRWWFDWDLALTKFGTRVWAYLALLRDEYPSTDDERLYHIEIPYPKAEEELHRWLPLIKWLLAIPHYIALFFLSIVALVMVIIAWFAILFTGCYPKALFDFVEGVFRWALRVTVYAFLLATDRYPPFRLSA
jgi:hypothetical protein